MQPRGRLQLRCFDARGPDSSLQQTEQQRWQAVRRAEGLSSPQLPACLQTNCRRMLLQLLACLPVASLSRRHVPAKSWLLRGASGCARSARTRRLP